MNNKKLKLLLASIPLLISNVKPPELEQTNFFYSGDTRIFRVRDGLDHEVNIKIPEDKEEGITRLNRGDRLPTLHIYINKNKKNFDKKVSTKDNKRLRQKSFSLADSRLIALIKHLGEKDGVFKKNTRVEDIISILSCIDKATKMRSSQILMDKHDMNKIKTLSEEADKVKSPRLNKDTTGSVTTTPSNRSQSKGLIIDRGYSSE